MLLERTRTPTTDRPGHLPEHDLHDGGRDRLPVQLLPLRKHLLPGHRPGAAARVGRAGDGLRPASDDGRRGSDGAALRKTRSPPGRVAGPRRRARFRSGRCSARRPERERREPRTAARLHRADRLHRTRDARHDGPRDGERAETRAGTLGRRLQHVSTGRAVRWAWRCSAAFSPPVDPSPCVPRSCSWPARTDWQSRSPRLLTGVRGFRFRPSTSKRVWLEACAQRRPARVHRKRDVARRELLRPLR